MTFPLGNFLNQTAQYQPFTGTNNRDDPMYGSVQLVPARIVSIDREKYGKDEDILLKRTKVWLAFQPALKSLINGDEIIATTALVGVDGSNPGWECILR